MPIFNLFSLNRDLKFQANSCEDLKWFIYQCFELGQKLDDLKAVITFVDVAVGCHLTSDP